MCVCSLGGEVWLEKIKIKYNDDMLDTIVGLLQAVPKAWLTVIVAALPVSELRGAIPLGIAMNQPVAQTFILAVIGNLIPVIPLLYLLEPVSSVLRRFRLWRGFFEWLFERTRKKAALVQKYEALGLMLFVAVPLPITGAWTGCVAASLFKIKLRYALPALVLGVLIAGCIVTCLTLAGKRALHF